MRSGGSYQADADFSEHHAVYTEYKKSCGNSPQIHPREHEQTDNKAARFGNTTQPEPRKKANPRAER